MRNDIDTVEGSDSESDRKYIYVEHILAVKSAGLVDRLTSQRKRSNQEVLLGFGFNIWVNESNISRDGRTGLLFFFGGETEC